VQRKAVIEILLVQESLTRSAREIEEDILKEFTEGYLTIPWSERIEKIKVVEA